MKYNVMNRYMCLRDDDACRHTQVQELEKAYGDLWGKIPLTLAVVPFVHGSWAKTNEMPEPKFENLRNWQKTATIEELTEFFRVSPLGENKELVDALKPLVNKNIIEIAEHGVFHRYNERGPEMFSDGMSYEAIRDGKEYLEKLFDTTVSFLVPPSNTIDVKCASYIKELGMNLFSSGNIVKDHTKATAFEFSSKLRGLKRRVLRKEVPPMSKSFGLMKFGSLTFTHVTSTSDLKQKLMRNLDKSGFAALGTHYTYLCEGGGEAYQKLLHSLMEEGVEFVTAKQYYNLIMNKYYE